MTQNISLEDTLAATKHLLTWQDNWDGNNTIAPKEDAIYRACNWIRTIQAVWPMVRMPDGVTSDDDGYVLYDWWKHDTAWTHRRLSISIGTDRHGMSDSWYLEIDTDDPISTFGDLTLLGFVLVWYRFSRVKLPLGNSENLYDPDLYYDLTRVPERGEA